MEKETINYLQVKVMAYKSRRSKKRFYNEDLKGQMWKNNLIGIVTIILFLIALFDIGGVISSISKLLVP